MTALPDPPQTSGTPVRRRFATAIEDYLAGKIDNFELDEAHLETASADEVCMRIGLAVWGNCYCDIFRHRHEGKHRLSPEGEAMVRRWIEMLRSDTDWKWERGRPWEWLRDIGVLLRIVKRREANYFWPFENETAWKDWQVRRGKSAIES